MRTVLRVPWGAWLVLGAALAIALTDGTAGIPGWLSLREDLAKATARVAALRAETEDLRREIGALERDPFALEQAIREDLVLARPGEIVVRFRSHEHEEGAF